jgi:hypothetical protein
MEFYNHNHLDQYKMTRKIRCASQSLPSLIKKNLEYDVFPPPLKYRQAVNRNSQDKSTRSDRPGETNVSSRTVFCVAWDIVDSREVTSGRGKLDESSPTPLRTATY